MYLWSANWVPGLFGIFQEPGKVLVLCFMQNKFSLVKYWGESESKVLRASCKRRLGLSVIWRLIRLKSKRKKWVLVLDFPCRLELKQTMKGTRSLSRSAGKREEGGGQFSAEARLRQCGRSTRTLTWFSNSPNRQPCPGQGRASRTIPQPWSEPEKVYCVFSLNNSGSPNHLYLSRSQPAQRRYRWRQLGRLQQCRAGSAGGEQLEYNVY